MSVVIAHIKPEEIPEAYGWHRGFAGANNQLFPRPRDHFAKLIANYQVVGAREDGEFVGMCYYTQDDKSYEWELGGLMVVANRRGSGLGAMLMFFRLGNLLIDNDPLANDEGVITHVLKGNEDPRGLITNRLRFNHRKKVTIPPDVLRGLPIEADGMVHGDEYEMAVPETLNALVDWCDGWTGELRDGTPVEIVLRESMTLADWSQGFREMANAHG